MRFALLLLPLAAFCQDQQQPPPKATLEGTVVNAVGGEPLRKARVTLRLNVGPTRQMRGEAVVTMIQAVTSDSAGKFYFPSVEPGDYQLIVRHDGFASRTLGGMTEGSKREGVVLGPGDNKAGLLVKLAPYAVISGRAVDEDGDPVQNLPVALMQYEYTSRGRELIEGRTGTTDDRGEYRIYDVPPGKYFLKFNHRGMRISRSDETESVTPTFFPGAPDVSNAAPFDIKAGQQLTGLVISLRKSRLATVRGRVIAPPNVQVNVGLMVTSDRGTSSNSNNLTDTKDYKFELGGLAPGSLFVTANYAYNGQRFSTQVPVEVGTDDINGLELRPGPPLDLAGTVRIDGQDHGEVLRHAGERRRDRPQSHQSVKEDGAFLLRNLESTTYRIGVNRTPLLYVKSITFGSADISESQLDLTAGVPPRAELAIVLGADAGEIEGTVMNDKEPAEGARVTLIRSDGRKVAAYFKFAQVDSAGKFSLRGIAPGTYRVVGWDKVDINAVQYDPDFLRPYDTAGVRVTIGPNEKKSVELKVTANLTPQP